MTDDSGDDGGEGPDESPDREGAPDPDVFPGDVVDDIPGMSPGAGDGAEDGGTGPDPADAGEASGDEAANEDAEGDEPPEATEPVDRDPGGADDEEADAPGDSDDGESPDGDEGDAEDDPTGESSDDERAEDAATPPAGGGGPGPRDAPTDPNAAAASGGAGGGGVEGAADHVASAAGALGSGLGEGAQAPDDQEMPLTEHVEEMVTRVLAIGLVVVGVGGITLFYADDLINFLWYSLIGPGLNTCVNVGTMEVRPSCPQVFRPRVYNPLSLVLARLKVASLVGIIAAVPVAVYQAYRFMRPGLYPRERRYYLAAVPTSLVLAVTGVGFAYAAVLPTMFTYFTRYTERAADPAFGLSETFNLIILMLGFFALVFQIPLLVMLAVMMGVTTRSWLEDRRLYFWGGFGAVAFLFSPDPTGMAPLMMAVTMIGLFEGTLALLRWTSDDSPLANPAAVGAKRPHAWIFGAVMGYLVSAAPVPGSYYTALPSVLREWLVANELSAWTGALLAAGLILVFEAMAYWLRQQPLNERIYRIRKAVGRVRAPVWVGALVVGYLGSPQPILVDLARYLAFEPRYAAAVGVGLVLAYELFLVGIKLRQDASPVPLRGE